LADVRTTSSVLADDEKKSNVIFGEEPPKENELREDPPKENKHEQAQFELTKFGLKMNDVETEKTQEEDEKKEANENDKEPVLRKNIYDTITMEPDVDLGDYIQLPS
jgi:hypothetical protein